MRRIIHRSAILILLLTVMQSYYPSRAAEIAETQRRNVAKQVTGWESVPAILARIKPPKFPARDFNIKDYGAVAEGDSTEAIRKAIAACKAAGGGRVVIPPGMFLTGAIHLKSKVNLHISEGATLKFSPDPSKYLPAVLTRFEGTECMNYSPFIYAFEQENIAVTGRGTLDGSASDENWWKWVRTVCRSVIASLVKGITCVLTSFSRIARKTFSLKASRSLTRRCGRFIRCCRPMSRCAVSIL